MMRKVPAFLFLFLIAASSCFGQLYPTQYRPSGQQWQYLSTPHFKLVYAAGDDSAALQTARILEEQYEPVRDLVGGELSAFPVILNSFNDRSNGFVTPLHFRSEIELPPIKSKSINPRTGSWLENVGPHELVHALQFSNLGGDNLPSIVSLFSPDLARSFHGALPPGVNEGIAVYHETNGVAPGGGRGNHAFFHNQFKAVFQSDDRWSMRQMVQRPDFTRPFDRHYIGGYEFTDWLLEKYGEDLQQELLDFHMDWPILGYGVALRRKTGSWPGALYHAFTEEKEQQIDRDYEPASFTELEVPYRGKEVRRPKWLPDSTLIFYGSFYNARPGFYRHNPETGETERLFTTNTVEDYRYDLSPDGRELIYSYYESDPVYDNTFRSELVRYDLSTGTKRRITRHQRVYAPQFDGESFLALQNRSASSSLVSVTASADTGEVITLFSPGYEIKAVAPNPADRRRLAVTASRRGISGLWIPDRDTLEEHLSGAPDIAFESGSIYDPEWHPAGDRLLFSSDFSGALQLYEYEPATGIVQQVTAYPFNAFEGSYHPDGNRIVFVIQKKNERIPAIIEREQFDGRKIPPQRWRADKADTTPVERPMSVENGDWESGPYRSGAAWLKPRALLPVFEDISNRGIYRIGFSLESNDLLQSQNYRAEFTYAEDRPWIDLSYQNKTYWPGFKTRLFSRPAYRTFEIDVEGETINRTLLREERGAALSVPMFVRLNRNIFSTSFFVEPEIRHSQLRYYQIVGQNTPASDYNNITATNLYSQFNFRLQQNIRDLQPNSGVILFSEVEHFLSSEPLNIDVYGTLLELPFVRPTALRGGIFTYLSPFRRWNQSLRVGIRALTQTHAVFDNQGLVSPGFSERVFETSRNVMSFDTRYTIPIAYVDDGWLLLPLYLTNIYMTVFSNTVADPAVSSSLLENSRTVFGLELRTRFRISNLSFDIGVGVGYEPTRNKYKVFYGYF